jgi:ketosteroid isomerase-like protein
MSEEQSRSVMDGYFTAMGTGDFAGYFTDDVTWTTMETGAMVSGPKAVQDHITTLHANMSDLRTTHLAVCDGAAYLEGSCAKAAGQGQRVGYCVAYELAGDRIRAMRAYGALAAFTDPPTDA